MNTNIILILEGLQCVWWIILSIIFKWNHQIAIITLASTSLVMKLGLLIQFRKINNKGQYLLLLLLILADTITYTEINLLLYQLFNPFSNHTNTLFIVTNQYIIKEIVTKQISLKIIRFCYPCYIILRLFSIIFIKFDYTILESIIIILVFVFAILGDDKSIISAKIRLSLQLNDEEQTDRYMHSLRLSKRKIIKQHESSHIFFNDQSKDKEKNRSPSNYSNKPQSYNDLLSIVRKKESIDAEKCEQQFSNSITKILQLLPDGLIILNKFQKLQFMNKKCLKLMQCKNEELILSKLKDCIRNHIINLDDCQQFQQPQNNRKIEMNQQTLEEIIKKAQQNKVQLDIFDVLLNQNKYLTQQFLHYGIFDGEKSSIDESPVSINNQNQFRFNLSLESNKSLKLTIIQTQMTTQQLDSFIQNDIQMFGDQLYQPVLVLILRDVTYKQKFQKVELKNQQFYHLLKKQLFQLRTPLNLNQQYLRIFSDITKEEQELTEKIELLQCSTSFLQYQMNNILDFISYQLNEFAYFFCRFQINELINEIEQMFIPYIFQKKIQFQIRIQSSLSEKYLNSDKLRIIQVLLNILNHQFNNIIQGGEITLIFIAKDEFTVQVAVENNSTQMSRKKQFSFNQIMMMKNQDSDSCNDIMTHPELGFGLNLAAKLASGFIEDNNKNIEILSNSADSSSISFLIQDQIQQKDQDQILQKEQDQNRNQSNTGGFMNLNKSQSWQQEDNFIIKKYCYQDNTDHCENSEKILQKSDGVKSFESPNIVEEFSERIIIPQSNYFQFRSIESPGQLIINKTFSFKISTLQLHECNTNCKKILIVDDQIFNQIALKAILSHFAIQCDQAYDGYQAIQKVKEKFQTNCQFYDIIFMDIELPGLNGFETSKEIISMGCKKTGIVICSAYDTKDNLIQFDHSGLCDYLKKPILQIELLQILKKYQLIYVNTIRPKDNPSETYTYYELPYCKPNDVDEIIETFGQSLSGDKQMTSIYKFNSKEKIEDKQLCQRNFTKAEINKWINAIDQEYIIEFYLADFIIQDVVGHYNDGKYYLKNRITFNLYVSNDQRLMYANITMNDGDFKLINSQDDNIEIKFYFTVRIKQYNEMINVHDHSIKWDLLIFKSIVILILVLNVFQVLRRSILTDYSNIPDEENEIEPQGWKSIKTESLMPPTNRIVFSALLGTGIHFLITIFILLILGSFDLFENHKGSIKSAGIIIYSFCGSINGYQTGKFYKFFGGKNWVLNLIIATVLFPISAILILFMIDIISLLFGTTSTFSFTAVFSVGFILIIVYLPLTIIGGVSGRLRTVDQLFEKRLKKKLLISNYLYFAKGCLYGIIPFISIVMELNQIMESTWSDKPFEQYALLIFSYIQLLIIVGCLSIIQTYKQLNQGNYNWQWISFLNGGQCIIYIFGFIFCYYYFMNMHGFFQFLFYFAESILACFVFWLMLGFVSYWISLKFVIYIYTQNKIQ
ncbi:unnamed protein product [Paramecium pentaurelia]|uniref:Response regulatory domain-containing protein n=1 Tax=Paramecium pentaurelia TaxID=43138 RepID=A0A8S1YBU5_9CILI|nr:unnamed protein product [Paramecium pentaurelia]